MELFCVSGVQGPRSGVPNFIGYRPEGSPEARDPPQAGNALKAKMFESLFSCFHRV